MQFEIRDPQTSRVLFSRGYASIYMEWASTGEPRTEAKTFGEGHALGLSQRRANVVREYLVQRGVPSGVITTEAFGHTRPSSEASTLGEDRRAQIEFTPGSGW